jgi:phage gpG-like protein
LSAKYAAAKQKRAPGAPILRVTGAMQDTAVINPKGQGFSVTSMYYGAYNQFGTSKMPARPWVGIPDDSLKKIVPIAWKNILS